MAAGSSRLAVAAVAATWIVASQSRAHPLVDEARAQADRAEFAEALATLDRAEAGDDLDRAALEDLLLLRALAAVGLGREADARRDLRRLVAIAPGLVLPDTVPPAIRAELDRIRASVSPVTVEVRVDEQPDSIELHASTAGEPGVVREVRLSARERGAPRASALVARGSASASVRVPRLGGAVEARASAIGPGGAVIAERGTEGEPLLIEARRQAPDAALAAEDEDGGGGGALWPVLGTTAAVLVIGVVVAAVWIGAGDASPAGDGGDIAPPTVAWP